jgi:hypothetical protein
MELATKWKLEVHGHNMLVMPSDKNLLSDWICMQWLHQWKKVCELQRSKNSSSMSSFKLQSKANNLSTNKRMTIWITGIIERPLQAQGGLHCGNLNKKRALVGSLLFQVSHPSLFQICFLQLICVLWLVGALEHDLFLCLLQPTLSSPFFFWLRLESSLFVSSFLSLLSALMNGVYQGFMVEECTKLWEQASKVLTNIVLTLERCQKQN